MRTTPCGYASSSPTSPAACRRARHAPRAALQRANGASGSGATGNIPGGTSATSRAMWITSTATRSSMVMWIGCGTGLIRRFTATCAWGSALSIGDGDGGAMGIAALNPSYETTRLRRPVVGWVEANGRYPSCLRYIDGFRWRSTHPTRAEYGVGVIH